MTGKDRAPDWDWMALYDRLTPGAVAVGAAHIVVDQDTEVLFLETRTGRVVHRVAKSEESKEGTATIRRLTLHGGGSIVERLEGKDDKKRTYTYSILDGPLPVAGYKATLHGEESKDGKTCKVEWSSTFEPAGASEPEAAKVIRGIYEAGFESLRRMFGT